MKKLSIIDRKFKLYDDNKKATLAAIVDFVQFYNSLEDWQDFSTEEKKLNTETRANVHEIKTYFDEKLIDHQGNITISGVNLNKDFSDSELLYLSDTTVTFDRVAIVNGWIVDTDGTVYSAINHAHFLSFVTLLGIDCSSYIRVTNKPIGNAKLNFSSASEYVSSSNPFLITEAQVRALENLKRLEELRFKDYPLPFEDYLIDSMLGGFIINEPNALENLYVIQNASSEPIFAKS